MITYRCISVVKRIAKVDSDDGLFWVHVIQPAGLLNKDEPQLVIRSGSRELLKPGEYISVDIGAEK